MTYAELSLFGRLRKQAMCGPYSMFGKLLHLWSNQLSVSAVSVACGCTLAPRSPARA